MIHFIFAAINIQRKLLKIKKNIRTFKPIQ